MAEENEVVEETTDAATDDELGQIFDDAQTEPDDGPSRGPDGKFVAKEAAPETVEDAEEIQDQGIEAVAEVEPEEPATPAIKPPQSWSDEAKAKWSEVSPELQQFLSQQEAGRREADEQKETWLRNAQPVVQALEPAMQRIMSKGQHPAQYVQQLVAADEYLLKDPQNALKWLAQQYGVTMPTADEGDEHSDPALTPVVNQITQLQSELSGLRTAQEQAQSQSMQSQIDAFAQDHPHFEKVRVQMGALIQSGAAQDMQTAYDMAVWASPETRQTLIAEKSKESEAVNREAAAKKAAEARRIAATNLSTKDSGGAPVIPDNIDDELSAAWDRAQGAS